MNKLFDETLDHRKNLSYRWVQPEGREDVLGMGTADMDFVCPDCVRRATQNIWEENTFNYRMKPEGYFQAILGWYERKYQLMMEKEWLSNVPGTIGAIRLLMGRFAGERKKIIMQSPYFGPLKTAVEGAGCELITNPMILKNGRYELDLADFEDKIRVHRPAVFLLVNPQNPTGRIFTREELKSLVDVCIRYQVLILSDEVHSLIVYEGKKHTPVLAVSEQAREISIQVVSMSKGFNLMSLPHAIVAIANPDIRRKWEEFLVPFSFGYASNSYCIAAVTAVMSKEAEEWLDNVTDYLQENRNLLISCLKEKQIPLVPLKPEAGYMLWIDCRNTGTDAEGLSDMFLKKAGISLNNGLEFGTEGRGFVRLNFAVTRENLKLALERIEMMYKKEKEIR